MNQKFSFRAIQQGQTQQSHVVNAGAGQNGQALVVRAAAGTRYQLADLLTLTSPKKLQLKRVGQDLMVALPGNDVTSPDIVIKDYFNFKDLSLSGLAASGEPMVYDTSSSFNIGQSATGITPESLAANKTTAATLATASGGWFDGGMGLAALGGGVALLAAAGGSSSSAATTGLVSKIGLYTKEPTKNISSLPVASDYSSAGVTGVNSGNLAGINSFLTVTELPLDTQVSVQTLVDSYNRITKKANGSAADTTTDEPTSVDYRNLMGGSTPNSLNSESPEYKADAVALLNDRIKSLNYSDISSYKSVPGLLTYTAAVEAMAKLVTQDPSTTGTAATAGNITTNQLTNLGVDVTATSLTAVSDAIRANIDLSALNTTAKLKALVEAYNTILAEANGATADATTANPTAADYATIGADIGSAKTDTAALARLNVMVGNLASTAVDTVGEITKLAATLDKIQTVAALNTGATLTEAQKFTADELKNLGLTGFTATNPDQNTALALKVSEAIRDKAVADVAAGDFTNGKLDTTGTRITWSQTQLERLQTLVSQEIIKNYVVDTTTPANTTLAPTATDWTNAGVFSARTDGSGKFDALSATQIAYLNTAVAVLPAASADTTAKLETILAAYTRIVQEANGTAADTNTSLNIMAGDLAAIGVSGVASASQAETLMLDIIANRSSTDVDTLTKLQPMANTAANILQAAAGTAVSFSAPELAAIGLRGASATGASSNLADFVNHLKGAEGGAANANSLAKLQSFMSLAVVQAWARDVNPDTTASPAVAKTAATPTAQDYKDIGVVRQVAKTADGTAGTVPATMAPADLNALNDAIDTLVNASSADVTAKIPSKAKVIEVATSYFKILNEANGSASDYTTGNTVQNTDGVSTANDAIDLNPNPTAADYQNIGVTETGTFTFTVTGCTGLLNTVIAEKNLGQVDTVKEIQTLATIVGKVLTLAGDTGTGAAPTLLMSEFSSTDPTAVTLSLQGVNLANLANVNAAIKAQSDNNVDSFAELQSLVSFTRIQRYADNSSTGTGGANEGGALPTSATGSYTDDWKNLIGVNDELSANYNAYNSAVDAHTLASLSDMPKVSSLVTSYNKILAEANGSGVTNPDASALDPTTTDFSNIGLDLSVLWDSTFEFTNAEGNGTKKGDVALKMLNDAVGELNASAISSVSQLTSLANTVEYLVNLASKGNNATPHADPNVNPTAAVSFETTTAPTAIPSSFHSDLAALGFVGAGKLGDTTYRYNGSQYNYFEKENVWASIQNTDVGSGSSTLLSYATVQAIVDKYAFGNV